MLVIHARPGEPQVAAEHTATNGGRARVVAATPAVHASHGVIVQALGANVGNVYVGGSTVDNTTGVELPPGASVTFNVTDPSNIYSWGTGASQKLHVIWV
jgi:hypothetical protein